MKVGFQPQRRFISGMKAIALLGRCSGKDFWKRCCCERHSACFFSPGRGGMEPNWLKEIPLHEGWAFSALLVCS